MDFSWMFLMFLGQNSTEKRSSVTEPDGSVSFEKSSVFDNPVPQAEFFGSDCSSASLISVINNTV